MKLHPHNIYLGILGSSVVSGLIILVLRPYILGHQFAIDFELWIRASLFVGALFVFIGMPFIHILVRKGWLNILGILGAGILVGVMLVLINRFGYLVSDRFLETGSVPHLTYVFLSCVISSLLLWLIGTLSYLIDRLRGIEPILK